MKKVTLLFISIMAFTLIGFTQHFGFQGGGMAANIKYRNDMYTLNTYVKPAFLAGIALEIPIKNTMAVTTALNYKWVGAAFNDDSDLAAYRLGYVNLDATFNYIFDMVPVVQPYVEGGGFLAYLVNASSVRNPEGTDDVIKKDLDIGTAKEDDIKPWDAGFSIGAGVYLNKWKFGVGYQESFINLSPDPDFLLWNKMGYLRATYFINRKKK
jgi:hypothetical protein